MHETYAVVVINLRTRSAHVIAYCCILLCKIIDDLFCISRNAKVNSFAYVSFLVEYCDLVILSWCKLCADCVMHTEYCANVFFLKCLNCGKWNVARGTSICFC